MSKQKAVLKCPDGIENDYWLYSYQEDEIIGEFNLINISLDSDFIEEALEIQRKYIELQKTLSDLEDYLVPDNPDFEYYDIKDIIKNNETNTNDEPF